MVPDFKTYQERDQYFLKHAEHFVIIKKSGVGGDERNTAKTLDEAERLAHTKKLIGGGRFLVYAVIGEQSAFVKAIP